MVRKILISLFFVFGLYYIFFIDSIDPTLKMVFKLIPMLLLIATAFFTSDVPKKSYYWFISVGLIVCAAGDYTIQWFIIGLTVFLTGHIFYIFAFRSTNVRKTPLAAKILLGLFGITMLGWISGSLLQQGETVLAVAVAAYIAIILTMGWLSFRAGSTFAVIGALLFITSDSILATNRFMFDIAYSHQLIMSTYYGAQFLLMLSIVQHFKIVQKPK